MNEVGQTTNASMPEASESGGVPVKKAGGKRTLLWVVLSVLTVVVVGLIVAIVVVNVTKTQEFDPGTDDTGISDYPTDRMTGIKNHIRTLTVEEALPYLDEQIAKYEGTEYDFDIKLTKAYVYINSGHYAEAMEFLDTIDANNLSELEKISLYEAYVSVHSGDEEEKEYYLALRNAAYYDYYGEGGGGE